MPIWGSWHIPYNFVEVDTLLIISILGMAGRQFLHLGDLEDIINDPNFLDSIDFEDDNNIDIVQLPPDNVDQVSDHEEIDEDLLEDTIPCDVPGKLELHCVIF